MAAAIPRHDARRRPDPALEFVADHPGPTPDTALLDRAGGGRIERGAQVLGADMEAVDVVEQAVVGLADDRERPPADPGVRVLDGDRDECVTHDPDAVGIGDRDRARQHP